MSAQPAAAETASASAVRGWQQRGAARRSFRAAAVSLPLLCLFDAHVVSDARDQPCCGAQGGGNNPFANMGALMENMKKAQEVVQVGGAPC